MALQPTATFRIPQPGSSITYQGIIITVTAGGKLAINGQSDDRCVQFSRRSGVAGSCIGYAILHDNQLKVFEGPSIGMGMLTREAVLAACR